MRIYATTLGDCAAGHPLSTDDARFIVERIFPAEFSAVSYDPATCTAAPIEDGGTDGGETVPVDVHPQPDSGATD